MKRVPSGILPIITIHRKAPKPLHRQIYDAYRTAIVSRSLRPGQRVPSTRMLASELGISRIPVLTAHAQLLAEGYFESRIGSGTVVCSSLPGQLASRESGTARVGRVHAGSRSVSLRSSILPSGRRSLWLGGSGAFSAGHGAFDQFPSQVWARLVVRHCRTNDPNSLYYGNVMGAVDLRDAIAGYLRTARAARCEASQIMIVSGSQQALDICARVLLDPGNKVWVEDPGYSFARDVFTAAGCSAIPIPVDSQGLDVADGIKRCRNARAAYVTPSHQFPLGVTMSASRRMQLLDWAQTSGAWIIEDDYDSEYRYESMPIASLHGLDANARVIYLGTFSKVLFPSLRLGYIVIPPDLVDRFLAIRRAMDLAPPTFLQAVVADFIREGHFARHLRRMRMLYGERRSVLADSIAEELGPMVELLGGEAGMHLTVTLKKGGSDLEIAKRAAHDNIWLWPLSSCYMYQATCQGFILGFGGTTTAEIPRAVRKLRNLLAPK
jgi:GntR family transcriptional regulator/MocR family aminotransferase